MSQYLVMMLIPFGVVLVALGVTVTVHLRRSISERTGGGGA